MAYYKMVDGKLVQVSSSDTKTNTQSKTTASAFGDGHGGSSNYYNGTYENKNTSSNAPKNNQGIASTTGVNNAPKNNQGIASTDTSNAGGYVFGDGHGGSSNYYNSGNKDYAPNNAIVNPNKGADGTTSTVPQEGTSSVVTPEALANAVATNTVSYSNPQMPEFPNRVYTEGQSVTDARKAYEGYQANKPGDWSGGTYGEALNGIINKILNRDKFTYDMNADSLYQQYKNQYMAQGNIAMQDAIAQASAMTGGYGNSYAATVGNQAYQGYLDRLNDKVPELYQLALDKYNQEGNDMYNQMSAIGNMYNTEYGQYRDQVSDWNNEFNRLYGIYNDEYNRDYGRFSDDRNYDLQKYNAEADASRFGQQMSLEQAKFDESKRQALADEAYKMAALNAKGSNSSSSSTPKTTTTTTNGYSEEDMQKASNSSRVKSFTGSIMTKSELSRSGMSATINGKKKTFDSYDQYVDSVLEKWYKDGELTEAEVAYLKGKYNL